MGIGRNWGWRKDGERGWDGRGEAATGCWKEKYEAFAACMGIFGRLLQCIVSLKVNLRCCFLSNQASSPKLALFLSGNRS